MYNDIRIGLCTLFKVIQNDPQSLCELLEWSIASKELFFDAYDKKHNDPAWVAYSQLIVTEYSFSSNGNRDWGRQRDRSPISLRDKIPLIMQWHDRMAGVQISNNDWQSCFDRADTLAKTHNVLVYCDPPYICTKDTYGTGFNIDQHRKLVQRILESEYRVCLSGYPHPVYDNVHWSVVHETDIMTLQGQGRPSSTKQSTERLYLHEGS